MILKCKLFFFFLILYCKVIQFKSSIALKKNYFGCIDCGLLVSQTGIEPALPTLEAPSLNPFPAREVPMAGFLTTDFFILRVVFSHGIIEFWSSGDLR